MGLLIQPLRKCRLVQKGDAKGKKVLDHPYFTQQRLLERAVEQETLQNHNLPEEEKNRMRQMAKEHGVGPWQENWWKNSQFSQAGPHAPWNNPKLTEDEREKLKKEYLERMGPYGMQSNSWGGMQGPWGNQGAMGPMGMNPWMNPNMSEKEREKMMKANPWDKWEVHGVVWEVQWDKWDQWDKWEVQWEVHGDKWEVQWAKWDQWDKWE